MALFFSEQLLLQLQLVQLPCHASEHDFRYCAAERRHSGTPSVDRLVTLNWAASRGGSTDGSATSVEEMASSNPKVSRYF